VAQTSVAAAQCRRVAFEATNPCHGFALRQPNAITAAVWPDELNACLGERPLDRCSDRLD
jgi:hypothetical protein